MVAADRIRDIEEEDDAGGRAAAGPVTAGSGGETESHGPERGTGP